MNLLAQFLKWLLSLLTKNKVAPLPTPVVGNESSVIDTPDWIVENQVSDPSKYVLQVIYREKYGAEKTIYCMVLFRNDKTRQYKAVAPWLKDVVVQMENITGKEATEVLKSSCLQFIMEDKKI
jgi:hypothetical protein